MNRIILKEHFSVLKCDTSYFKYKLNQFIRRHRISGTEFSSLFIQSPAEV